MAAPKRKGHGEIKYYIRAPTLDYTKGGPIQLGHVLKDPFNPEDPVFTWDPLRATTIVSAAEPNIHRKYVTSTNAGLSAKVYQLFGGNADAKTSDLVKTNYQLDAIETEYFTTNPTNNDAKNLVSSNEAVRSAMKRIFLGSRPLYIITGLKIAKNLTYSSETSSRLTGSIDANVHVVNDVEVEGELGGTKDTARKETYRLPYDAIIAYRLHVIQPVGWLGWLRQTDVEAKRFTPKEDGFLSKEKTEEVNVQEQLEVKDASVDDLSGFVEEQEYDGYRKVNISDDTEDCIFLCVDQ